MQETSKPIVFISHIHEDVKLATTISKYLTEIFAGGIEFFVSSDKDLGISGGEEWWEKIKEKLKNAKIVFVILSQRASNRPWVYFEAGGAYFLGKKPIPLRIGIDMSDFNPPLSTIQSYSLSNANGIIELIATINKRLERTAKADGVEISKKLLEINENIIKEHQIEIEKQKTEQRQKRIQEITSHSLANLNRQLHPGKRYKQFYFDSDHSMHNSIYFFETEGFNCLVNVGLNPNRNNIIEQGEKLLNYYKKNKTNFQNKKIKLVNIIEVGDDSRGDGRTTSTVLNKKVIILKYNFEKDIFHNIRAVFQN